MICLKCGYENPVGSNYCDQCSCPLPRMEIFQVLEPTIVSGRLRKIQGYVESIQKGEISLEDFADFIKTTYETLVQKSIEIQEFVDSTCYRDISPEEVEIGYEGMGSYEEGLREMYSYIEDLDLNHLVHGIELITHGNNCINEAMRINRENRDNEGVIGTL